MQQGLHKRKIVNLGVKYDFQLWLLIRILGVVLLSTLVAVLILYFYTRQEIAGSFYTAHVQIRRVSDLLIPVMAAGAFVSVLSGILLAVFLPQKIAGPVYRVQKGLEQLAAGNLNDYVKLRRGDAFGDLAESINTASGSLRHRIDELKELQSELEILLADVEHREASALAQRQGELLKYLRTNQDGTGSS